jgi:osmotically-inducible protein OsmY
MLKIYFLLLFFLTSCVETAIIGGGGLAVLHSREKTLTQTKSDVVIASGVAVKLLTNKLKMSNNFVDTTVYEGRVLLTGVVDSADKAKLAQDLAWQVEGVLEVIDEIQVCDNCKMKITDSTKILADSLITTEIETKLFLAKRVRSFNFTVNTVQKTVYIIGIAYSLEEQQMVLKIASKVKGVEKVVNHIILADDLRRKQQ